MPEEKEVKLFQWNCRSLRSNLSQFKLQLYLSKPHIACLCETWLSDTFEPSFINYSCFYKHRPGGVRGGGLAILVRSDVSFSSLPLAAYPGGALEFLSISLHLAGHSRLDFLSVYNPLQSVSEAEFTHYFSQLGRHRVILGDFNGHHPLWDPNRAADATGSHLVEALLLDPSLTILTPETLPTYYDVRHNSFSTLDLTLISSPLASLSTLWTAPDIGSDHFPVVTRIGVAPCTVRYAVRPRWKFDTGSWPAFQRALLPLPPEPVDSLHDSVSSFTANLIAASAQAFQRTKDCIYPRYNKPWWNAECARLVALKHQAKKRLISQPSLGNLIAFKRAAALVKREVKLAKTSSWSRFCQSLSLSTPSSHVYRRMRRLQSPFLRQSQPFSTPAGILCDPAQKAEALAGRFARVFSQPPPRPGTEFILPLSLALSDDTPVRFTQPFHLHELEAVLGTLRDSSPGIDCIHNQHLAHLPPPYMARLLDIFNLSLATGTVPPTWKHSLLLPLPKPQKPLTSVDSFRPISLLSCISKVLERLICSRLSFFLETSGHMRRTQGGFRRRLSAIDQFARLESAIRSSLARRESLVVVFCDLSSAFDVVWHSALLYKLSQLGVRGNLLAWISSYLSGRSFHVLYEGVTSSRRPVSAGVPQGAVLSPLLFNIMLSDIPSVRGVETTEYADDLAFFATHPDPNAAAARVQLMLDAFQRWTAHWGMKVNIDKTKCMLFTRRRLPPPRLTFLQQPLSFVAQHRFLGILLDAPGLRWLPYLRSLRSSCLRPMNALQSISHHRWGASRVLLLQLYKVLVRSRLDYAAPFYSSAAASHLARLDSLQNQCLRIAVGARRTTPVCSLEVEAHVLPLRLHRQQLVCSYLCRLGQLPSDNPVALDVVVRPPPQELFLTSASRPPFAVTALRTFRSLSLPAPLPRYSPLLSPVPPWIDLTSWCCSDFASAPVAELSSEATVLLFRDLLESHFPGFLAAYTDGSRVSEPLVSVSAALEIPSSRFADSWKLDPSTAVLGAELFAITQALLWARANLASTGQLVILTDSLNSVALLSSRRPSSYLCEVFRAQRLLLLLNSTCAAVRVQFVPSHRSIPGNEAADRAAAGPPFAVQDPSPSLQRGHHAVCASFGLPVLV